MYIYSSLASTLEHALIILKCMVNECVVVNLILLSKYWSSLILRPDKIVCFWEIATTHTKWDNQGHFAHKTEGLCPYTSSTLIGGKGEAGPSSLHTTLEGPTNKWMQDRCKWPRMFYEQTLYSLRPPPETGDLLLLQNRCKVYMNFYKASNESCFMVTWNILNNHLLEVDLTQKWETMALRHLTTDDHMRGPHMTINSLK